MAARLGPGRIVGVKRRRFQAMALVLILFLAPWSSASTDLPATERALEFGRRGIESFQQRDWIAAYAAFVQAERAAHSPVFVLYQARCKRNGGELVAGKALYEKLVGEAVTPDAPEAWKNAVSEGVTELAALDVRVPTVRLALNNADGEPALLWIDGVQVGPVLGGELTLDPGEHAFYARANPDKEARQTVTLLEYQKGVRVTLDLVSSKRGVEPNPVMPNPVTRSEKAIRAPALPRPERESDADLRVPAIVALGLSAALASVGTVTGVAAWRRAQDIQQNCSGSQCRPQDRGLADSAADLASVSNVAFGAAGLALAAGIALWSWPASGGVGSVGLGPGTSRLRFGFSY
jgi:hypothetical protein